jgi:hypothetical protein
MFQTRDIPFFVGMEDHFRVGSRSEKMSFLFKPFPDLLEIIDLSVEYDPEATILVGQGLMACL